MRARPGRQSWKRIGSIAVLAALSWVPVQAGTPTAFAPPQSADLVLYRDATLIDGTGAPARPHMDVLVAGERILSVFPDAARPAEAAKAKVVDLHGQYLMPGLIDSHVHLATPPNRRQAEAMLRRDLYGGVTAVRDMADDLRALGDITRASRVGEIAGSDVYYAALMAGPDFFTDPRTAQTSAGGVPGQVPWMQAVTDQTDLPLAVARSAGTSATAIKLYADLDPNLAGRITTEAHRQHLLVWSHATLYPAKPSEVVAAGVDAISHACLLVREPDPDVPRWSRPRHPVDLAAFRAGDNPALARFFAVMAKRGVILDATVWTYGAAPPSGASSTPPLTPGGCDDIVGGAITGQAYRAGVQISAGTDNVAPWTDPWPDLFHELSELAERAGMPPAAVLRSATLVGARAAGQERDMGSLEPGKLANMVVLSKNPLSSIDNLKTVVMTVKRGRVFLRDDFVPLREADITDF
jgi:imidazolonepropionase-like amidohydrolase